MENLSADEIMSREDNTFIETSWRDIQQSVARRTRISQRVKRLLRSILKIGAFLTAAALVIGGTGYALYQFNDTDLLATFQPQPDTPFQKIYFKTDGVLDEQWLEAILSSGIWSAVQDDSVTRIHDLLVSEGQVKEALVERVSGDALSIRLQEHTPLLRVVVRHAGLPPALYLIAENGALFRPVNYTDAAQRHLPYADRVLLDTQADGGFEIIPGMPRAKEILDALRMESPALYAQLKVVGFGNFTGRDELGQYLTLQLDDGLRVQLPVDEYTFAIRRLAAIHSAIEAGQTQEVAHLDLTLSKPVLRLANDHRKAGPRHLD